MSVMLYKLRGLEEEEADEIRLMLEEHGIDFYETSNGRWGLGFAAIWLHDDALLAQGKALIHDYQKQRLQDAQAYYAQLCAEGNQPTLWRRIKGNPIQVVLVWLAIFVVSMFALIPFVYL